MSLHELSIPANITVKVPEKSFFKKFPYKMEFVAVNEKKQTAARTTANHWAVRRSNYWNVKQEVTNKLKTLIAEAEEAKGVKFDYRLRQEGCTVSLFFSDPEVLQLVLADKIKSKATVLYKPINENHLARMEIEKRIRVRKTLFIGKFKYKLYLKAMALRKVDIGEIESWLLDTFPEEDRVQTNPGLRIAFLNKNPKAGKYSWQYNSTLAVYFNDETDLMIAKLRLHDYISHVEEAVLISEL